MDPRQEESTRWMSDALEERCTLYKTRLMNLESKASAEEKKLIATLQQLPQSQFELAVELLSKANKGERVSLPNSDVVFTLPKKDWKPEERILSSDFLGSDVYAELRRVSSQVKQYHESLDTLGTVITNAEQDLSKAAEAKDSDETRWESITALIIQLDKIDQPTFLVTQNSSAGKEPFEKVQLWLTREIICLFKKIIGTNDDGCELNDTRMNAILTQVDLFNEEFAKKVKENQVFSGALDEVSGWMVKDFFYYLVYQRLVSLSVSSDASGKDISIIQKLESDDYSVALAILFYQQFWKSSSDSSILKERLGEHRVKFMPSLASVKDLHADELRHIASMLKPRIEEFGSAVTLESIPTFEKFLSENAKCRREAEKARAAVSQEKVVDVKAAADEKLVTPSSMPMVENVEPALAPTGFFASVGALASIWAKVWGVSGAVIGCCFGLVTGGFFGLVVGAAPGAALGTFIGAGVGAALGAFFGACFGAVSYCFGGSGPSEEGAPARSVDHGSKEGRKFRHQSSPGLDSLYAAGGPSATKPKVEEQLPPMPPPALPQGPIPDALKEEHKGPSHRG